MEVLELMESKLIDTTRETLELTKLELVLEMVFANVEWIFILNTKITMRIHLEIHHVMVNLESMVILEKIGNLEFIGILKN